MEALDGMSVDVLKFLALAVAILFGIAMLALHRRRWQWPAFEAAFAYIIANLTIIFYILSRPLDPRWSAGKESTVNAPDLPQGPIVDVVTNPLSEFLGGVTGDVNALVNAGSTALDFLVLTAWGLAVAVAMFIFAKIKDQREQRSLLKRVRNLEKFTGINDVQRDN